MARQYPKINNCKKCGGTGREYVPKENFYGDSTQPCSVCGGLIQFKLPFDVKD